MSLRLSREVREVAELQARHQDDLVIAHGEGPRIDGSCLDGQQVRVSMISRV
jgi:hypothetical protein